MPQKDWAFGVLDSEAEPLALSDVPALTNKEREKVDLLLSGITENSRAEIETKHAAYREGRIAKGIEPHPGFRLSKASSPSERPR